ncbi:AMP-binding protein [Psychromonas sp. CD1]|uniref:AMP-binding protein n=1 Tax=Psychromonas sp. CD1 TaxID=1979839 RepID=UPI000B9B506D|nr:AMP-binding protein [Psychromonas sp. CD1]
MDQRLDLCPVRYWAKSTPKAIAFNDTNKKVSFQQLDLLIDDLYLQLSDQQVQEGDRLVSISKNSFELVTLQLCCIRYAIIFCPLNPRFSSTEIEQCIDQLVTSKIWTADKVRRKGTLQLQFKISGVRHKNLLLDNIPLDSEKICNIIFTSGSSGQAKAVMHNFRNHYYSAKGSLNTIALKAPDINYLSLPQFHISGYATVIRTILSGATLFLSQDNLSVCLLKKEKITHLSLVSTQLYRLLHDACFKASKLTIKHLLLGGSAFSESLLTETRNRGFVFHLSYGSTEMSSQIATSSNNTKLLLLPYRELKIKNDEILLRGATRFIGYFKNQVCTSTIASEKWFKSKDIGYFKQKKLTILGRKDRQFISGGENIQPEKIEETLLTLPYIEQAYVVPFADKQFGQRPVAFIKWRADKRPKHTIKQDLQTKLASFLQPIHYFDLPMQIGFKISLKELCLYARQHHHEIDITNKNKPF